MRRVRVVVSGRVQGVFYRQSCIEKARAAGLAGWVRNRPDGRVEGELEGEATAVASMLTWMEVGPPMAVVADLEVTELAPEGTVGFEVR